MACGQVPAVFRSGQIARYWEFFLDEKPLLKCFKFVIDKLHDHREFVPHDLLAPKYFVLDEFSKDVTGAESGKICGTAKRI